MTKAPHLVRQNADLLDLAKLDLAWTLSGYASG